MFLWQMGAGGVIGLLGGRLLARGIAHLTLSPGLYPLLALFGGLFIYGAATELQTSGFLAVYLAGLIVGQKVGHGIYSIQRFHDGVAWLAQISMFLILGLLVTPAELLPYAPGAILTGLVLMFIARPVAVVMCLLPFRFKWQEHFFISWVGLRGAVPIVLAMFPWIAGLEQWQTYFSVAFVIVLMSLVIQGWSVAPLAKRMNLNIPSSSNQVQRVEMGIPGQAEYEIVGYQLSANSELLGHPFDNNLLPQDARLVCVLRDNLILDSNDPELLFQADDQLYFLAKTQSVPEIDRALVNEARTDRLAKQAFFGEFVLNPLARLADLGNLYDFEVPPNHGDWSIARLIQSRYSNPVVGDRVRCGMVEFVVLEMDESQVKKVSLKLPH
ncbi:MAG: potassium/proton antiporter [Pseudohongiellaceae bacterium]